MKSNDHITQLFKVVDETKSAFDSELSKNRSEVTNVMESQLEGMKQAVESHIKDVVNTCIGQLDLKKEEVDSNIPNDAIHDMELKLEQYVVDELSKLEESSRIKHEKRIIDMKEEVDSTMNE